MLTSVSDGQEEEKKTLFSLEKIPFGTKGKEKQTKIINGLPIELTKLRGDVVLKTILRYLRRLYLEDFKKTTKYIKSKRYQG
jgi:hypothetical protein